MKKWKKIGLTALTAAMALTMGACGSGNTDGGKDKADGKKGDYDLSIFAQYSALHNSVKNVEESPFHKGLEEETGIKMDWQFITEGADGSQAFNLMLSEDKLPDLIWGALGEKSDEYLQDGILRDLTDLLPEKAPNYWKFLEENPEYAKGMRSTDGKYYMFGFFREKPNQASYQGPMIRKDWLDEQGLPLPTNIAEWTTTIEKFNEAYGAKFALLPSWKSSLAAAGGFGAHGTFRPEYYVEDGKIQIAQNDTEWKDYMTWLNDLYKRDLLDRDFATMDDETLRTKVANNQIGFTNNNGSSIDNFNLDAESNGTTANWVGVKYPKQADGSPTAGIFFEGMFNYSGIGISTDCSEEDLDKALEWLDFAWTEEGRRYWNYGKEGESWEMKDGVPTFTDLILNNPLGKNDAMGIYTGNAGFGQGVQEVNMIKQRSSEASYDAAVKWSENETEALAAAIPPGVTLTPEESKEAAQIQNTLDTYVMEQSIKFVTGEVSLDKYDDFKKEMKNQGLDRLLEIKQASYDRYLKR